MRLNRLGKVGAKDGARTPRPTLDLNFMQGSLPSGMTFTRASPATYVDITGAIQVAAIDQPRFDYSMSAVGTLLGYLSESQRTNLLLQSGDLQNVVWFPASTTQPVAGRAAPNGSASALLDVTTAGAFLRQIVAGTTPAAVYTFSVYVRAAATTPSAFVRLTTNDATSWNTGLSKKVAVTANWQRVTLTGALSSGSSINCMIGAIDAAANADGTCNGKIEVWGAQLELGASATSIIYTTSAAATRVFDRASMPTATWYDAAGGLFMCEATVIDVCDQEYPRFMSLESADTTSRVMVFGVGGATSYSTAHRADVGGSNQSNFGDSVYRAYGAPTRVLLSMTAGMYRIGTGPNASQGESSSSPPSLMPVGAVQLYVGTTSSGQNNAAHIKRITYRKQPVADHPAMLVELSKL